MQISECSGTDGLSFSAFFSSLMLAVRSSNWSDWALLSEEHILPPPTQCNKTRIYKQTTSLSRKSLWKRLPAVLSCKCCFKAVLQMWLKDWANNGVECSIFPDTSGVVFDTRSKMVMSQGGTAERMKEKVRPKHTVRMPAAKSPAGCFESGSIGNQSHKICVISRGF